MTDLEIREQIARYTRGEIDASRLEDWLEDASWDVHEPAESLAANALRLLAEHANGDWTDPELREQLGALSRTYWFERAPKLVFMDSSAQVSHQVRPSAVPETQRVAASV